MKRQDKILAGEILKPHGVGGSVLVKNFSEVRGRFRVSLEVYLVPKEAAKAWIETETNNSAGSIPVFKYKISAATEGGKDVILHFANCDTWEAAKKLCGQLLYVDRSDALMLPPGSYYTQDLVDLTVFDTVHGELGIVSEILFTGANAVFVVQKPGEQDILIPFLKSVVKLIEPEKGEMHVVLPAGLYEIYR